MAKPIPKARQYFSGDINAAVKRVQQATGEYITPNWWSVQVTDRGTPQEILDRFDKAYAQELKKRKPNEY